MENCFELLATNPSLMVRSACQNPCLAPAAGLHLQHLHRTCSGARPVSGHSRAMACSTI